MALVDNIQKFLKKKLQENNLKGKSFALKSQIPYPTINKILNAVQSNPELITILKIANYFNCSIDEILGRDTYIFLPKTQFYNVLIEDINFNLRTFLDHKLKKNNLNPYKLGRQIGFSEHPITEFIQKDSKRKRLSSAVIVALADYFKISVDEMVGRTKQSNQELQQNEEAEKVSSGKSEN